MDITESEIDYQERLSRYKKYRKGGVDIAFRCFSCGKLVFQSDVLSGRGCIWCGSMKVRPITESLTFFGLHYCRFWSWVHAKRFDKKS